MIGTECHDAEHKCANRDIAHDAPFAEAQRRDQAHTERLFLIDNFVISLDENDFAAPDLFEADAVDGQDGIRIDIGILQDDDTIFLKPLQDEVAAVPESHDGRQGLPLEVAKALPIEPDKARRQSGGLGAFDQLRHR